MHEDEEQELDRVMTHVHEVSEKQIEYFKKILLEKTSGFPENLLNETACKLSHYTLMKQLLIKAGKCKIVQPEKANFLVDLATGIAMSINHHEKQGDDILKNIFKEKDDPQSDEELFNEPDDLDL